MISKKEAVRTIYEGDTLKFIVFGNGSGNLKLYKVEVAADEDWAELLSEKP